MCLAYLRPKFLSLALQARKSDSQFRLPSNGIATYATVGHEVSGNTYTYLLAEIVCAGIPREA